MKPNVLLIIMDSVRAKNTNLHNYSRNTTPFLSNLADTATVYEHAISPSHWSLPSHASLFTGYHVDEHMLTSRKYSLEPGHTIWEQLSQLHDYSTGVFSTNPFITNSDFGLNPGFDTTVKLPRDVPFREGVAPSDLNNVNYMLYLRQCLGGKYTLKSIFNGLHAKLQSLPLGSQLYQTREASHAEEFLSWQADVSGPWGACINLMEAHAPYADSEQSNEWDSDYLRKIQNQGVNDFAMQAGERHWFDRIALEKLYDCAIATIDQRIKLIIETLRDRDVLDETLVVITSDHGEGFGEQSNVRPNNRLQAHSFGLHEALLHVPLITKLPGQTEQRRVSERVSLTAFPDAVNAALSEEDTSQLFVGDTEIIASGHNNRMEEYGDMIREYFDSTERFSGEIKTTYTDKSSDTLKFIQWGDDEATVRVHKPGVTEKISQSASGEVESAFGDLSDREIRIRRNKTNEHAKQRLKELGYID